MKCGEGISGDGLKTYGSIGHHGLWKGHLVFITAKHVLATATQVHSTQKNIMKIGTVIYKSNDYDFCIVKLQDQKPSIPLSLAPSYNGDRIIGLEVYKIGAATGFTKGFINFTDGPLHYMVRPVDTNKFAEPGDSGAAVFAVGDGRPVGILLGQLGLHWLVLSIQAVIEQLSPEFRLLTEC
jgi:hypothetical protein